MVCGAISLSDQKIPAAETCRNCGHENVEVFCARCGQESSLHILPIGEAISDVVGEFISFDSRLYVTLKPLLTRPGFLTCEYLRGKRAAFIAPLRLYLMMSAVHFLLFSYYAQPQMQKMFAASASTNFFRRDKRWRTRSGRVRFGNRCRRSRKHSKGRKTCPPKRQSSNTHGGVWAMVFRPFVHPDAFLRARLCGRNGAFISAAKAFVYGAFDFHAARPFV